MESKIEIEEIASHKVLFLPNNFCASTKWRPWNEPCLPSEPLAHPDQAFGGGSQIEGRQKCLHLLKYQRLSATIVVRHTKEVIFCRSKCGYFCWANYAIFQGITTV